MTKFICGVTGECVESDELPENWVIPHNIAQDIDKPIPEKGTIIAISSQKVLSQLLSDRLREGMQKSSIIL